MLRKVLAAGFATGSMLAAASPALATTNPIPPQVPAACVEQSLPYNLHVQVGYCP